jgi:hypothetical protein
MWPFGVVVLAEFIQLLLKLADCCCLWLFFEPFLQRLVEPLYFTLGLWMPWAAVLLLNHVFGQQYFESVSSSFSPCKPCGKHETIVSQCGCRWAVGCDELLHGVGNLPAGAGGECFDMQQESGMVIEEVEDINSSATSEPQVSNVGLPAFVWLCRFEADIAVARSFLWLWGNQARLGDDASDCGNGWDEKALLAKVVGNSVRACIEAVFGEILPNLDDFLTYFLRCTSWIGVWGFGLWQDGLFAAGIVALE